MKHIIYIISAFTALFLSSCNSTPDLSEEEVYSIINEIIALDSLSVYKACWKFENIQLTDEHSKEFTKEDVVFIKKQNNLFKNSKIKPNKLKWYRKRSKTTDFITIDTLCNKGILYHISFPLISADRKKVMIEFREDCNCNLGGQGGKFLYEKRNEHWVFIKMFDRWISDRINKKIEQGAS